MPPSTTNPRENPVETPPPSLDARLRARAAMVIGTTLVAHLVLDLAYRPWALPRQLADLGLAASFTQVTAVVGSSAVMVFAERSLFWKDRAHEALLIVAPVIAMLAYEAIQHWLPGTHFDVRDLAWTILGGSVAAVVKRTIYDPAVRSSGESSDTSPTFLD